MSAFWKMTTGKIMDGVFAINKPTGISSAQALRDLQTHFNPSALFAPWIESETKSRNQLNPNQRQRRKDKRIQVKIGHGGTLDPLATGVLIAGVGKGTKSLQDFLTCTKEYDAVLLFGTSTNTYDRVGKVLKRAPYEHITKQMVEKALSQFRGKFMQLPPLFSALKMDGKPLYEYAREGKEIPRNIERRPVEVLKLEMVEWMEGGTHKHEAPTDEAGYAEVNVANKLWAQENVLPASAPGADMSKHNRLQETQDIGREVVEPANIGEKGLHKGKKVSGEKDAQGTSAILVGIDSQLSNDPQKEDASDLVGDEKGESTGTLQGKNDEHKLEEVAKVKSSTAGQEHSIVDKVDRMSQADDGQAGFEQMKRKLVEDQDDLVHERPASKQRKNVVSSEDAVMSGGLAPPESTSDNTASASAPLESVPVKSSAVKGPPACRLRMTVTSGFYVRSLCHDLGAAVGSAALMAELERTRQGDFELGKNVLEYKDLEGGEEVWGPKVKAMLEEWNQKGRALPRD